MSAGPAAPPGATHARDIAVVFAGLIGTPQDHVVDLDGIDAGALNQCRDGVRGKVSGRTLASAPP